VKQMVYSPTDHEYLLTMLLDNFAVDLVGISQLTQYKRSMVAWTVFSTILTHLSRPEKPFYLCPRQKRELVVEIITPSEFTMTSGEYLQRGVHQSLRVVHKAQRKVRPNRLGPHEEKNKKNFFLSPSIF
jgi:hypothetical protein